MSKITILHRDLMQMSPHDYYAPEGESLAQMSRRVKSLPEGWPRHEHDVICINGHPVPRALWGAVKPRATSSVGGPVRITFHAPPMGGGDDGGKSVLGIVASIALFAVAGPIAGATQSFALGNLTRSITTAAFLGKLAGAAVLIGGSAILQSLAPTPKAPEQQDSDRKKPLGSAGAQGNILEPNAALPRVVGTRKVFPPFVIEPLVYYDGEQEVAEAIAALAGPHKLENIRVGEAPIEDVQGVEFETREGWAGLDDLTLVTRYGRTVDDGTPIRGHLVSEEDKNQLESRTGNIEDALPPAKVIATRDAPDQFWIGIQFSQGLDLTTDPGVEALRVPLRIRIRPRGTETWTNLPELHFQDALLGTRRAMIKFAWRDGPVNVSAASTQGWVEARIVSPGQAIAPNTDDWIADSYFDADTGGDHYVSATNAGSTDVTNIIMGDNEAEFQLDRATFPPGIYEVEIKRGYAFKDSDYTASSYEIDGDVRDPFHFEGSGAERIFQTRKDLIDELTLVRYNSVWNASPVLKGDASLIAIKARDVRVDRLSVLASGYVRDWDGSGWTDWKTTDNPAPHIRDALAGLLNATPIPAQVVDDQSLVDFRTAAWTCNAIMEGTSVGEAVKIMAGTGFGQLYQSEKVGVIRDRDRSADSPVQIFTPNNSANFSWSRGYPKLPDGFRATFVDADADYEARQIIHPVGASRTEQTTIEGLVHEADVRARLQYDLDTARYRSGFYSWDASAEAIKCRRGSLVGVVADALSARLFSGRVADFEVDASGDVTAVQLDNEADLTAEDAWADIADLSAVQNMALIGATFGLVIRRKGKVATVHQVTSSALGADWVDIETAATLPDLDYGDVAAIGPLGKEYRRLIVVDMVPRSLLEWTLTAVPEAPELWL